MEDSERYLKALRRSIELTKKITNLLEEDKQNIHRGLSGEAEEAYIKQCDQAIDQIKKIQKSARVLYSESSTGY